MPEILQSYQNALDYLYGFINWEIERHVRYAPEVMTLERPRALLAALGNPHENYPILHITGTKGKGSVGAMCAAALQAAGLRTGLYSSPHLQDFRERFRVNNQLIFPEEFTELINMMQPAIESIPELTWFEITTALAFLFFAQRNVDVAIAEVGLGGRLDATNVVTPIVSVVTSLSYDHTHLLGDSLASIAREKGGIIKPGIPAVSAPQPEEALDVLMEIAAERGAPLTLVGRDWVFSDEQTSWRGEVFTAGPAGGTAEVFRTALLGKHQAVNGTVAIAALEHARQAGVPVGLEQIRCGFAQVDWPGRLEIVKDSPLLVLDAAHNGASAQLLRDSLENLFSQRPRALIFGASVDKDIDGMLKALLPAFDYLIAAQAVHPRAIAVDEIERIARGHGFEEPVFKIPDVRSALVQASDLVGVGGLVCTTGSLFIVGEMRTVCNLTVGHVEKALPDASFRWPTTLMTGEDGA